jgi:hypothetical protein
LPPVSENTSHNSLAATKHDKLERYELADLSGIYLGGLASADPERNPVPGFVERRLSRGV